MFRNVCQWFWLSGNRTGKKVHHTTVINWVKEVGNTLADTPEKDEIPEITQVDELETFIGKKNKIWLWTAVNKHSAGVIAWVLGDRSSETSLPVKDSSTCQILAIA